MLVVTGQRGNVVFVESRDCDGDADYLQLVLEHELRHLRFELAAPEWIDIGGEG